MTNGLGTGLFALTLLAGLAGLAILVIIATGASALYHRRTGRVPTFLRYLLVVLCLAVICVAGFGILLLFDEAPAAAWLVASIVVVPLLVVGSYFAGTTGLSRFAVITATVMAWGGPFFIGVVVVVGVMNGIDSVFHLTPVESRQIGVPRFAATVGGLTVIISMLPLGNRLGKVLHAAPGGR